MPKQSPVKRALISVSDKSGLTELARSLTESGIEILSTGGTRRHLTEAGLEILDISEFTGLPEMMDGRVKTLHPRVHGGLLAVRSNREHQQAMADHEIKPIDVVIINLYPFEEALRSGADAQQLIENIDIGGPAMIRSAAKNHQDVTVIVDPDDYAHLISALKDNNGAVPAVLRSKFAAKAFARTAAYDSMIASWFAGQTNEPVGSYFSIGGRRESIMRYGENPHQSAALYRTADSRPGAATARQIQGKQLSYNNINDTDAAFELVAEFSEPSTPAVAIIKHANPCGVAVGSTLLEAYEKALSCDPVSAFGGIIALNQSLDGPTAKALVKLFTEVIIAPDADDAALKFLVEKPNLRLLLTGQLPDPDATDISVRSVAGGLLVQTADRGQVSSDEFQTVTRRNPTDKEMDDMAFAFRVCKHVKSNAIVYAKDGATVGIGAGQMSRVDSARIAARKAEDATAALPNSATSATIGSVVASDAFFPFADGLQCAIEAGATAVIQPGGSMRDNEVIAAADDAGLAMVFTGMRHFRH